MDKKHWQKIKSLFEAVSGLPLEERQKFLEENCGKDIKLRQEFEKLLNSFEEAETSNGLMEENKQ